MRDVLDYLRAAAGHPERAGIVEIGGPEYETTTALGPMCWIDDPEAIIYANHLCNIYGLDTISAGVTIAFAMELHEKGLLDDAELSLEWGDVDTLHGLLERIAYREGLGDLLAGSLKLGPRLDAEAIHSGSLHPHERVADNRRAEQDPGETDEATDDIARLA